MKNHYYILDVFTTNKLEGNPLAVVTGAESIEEKKFQRLAAEFNLSETVFVLPPDNPDNTAKLRIFTPARELAFAGHPTIGTSVLLANLMFPDSVENKVLRLELKSGVVECTVAASGDAGTASFSSPGVPEKLSLHKNPSAAARAIGLTQDETGFRNHVPAFVSSSGTEWLFIPVKNSEVIRKAEADMSAWEEAHEGHEAHAVYVYTDECETAGASWHARMFAPAYGIKEDPATGAAAVTFPGVLAAFERPDNGRHEWIIEQGYEMGRPSQIHIAADFSDGKVTKVQIRGNAVILMEGILRL